VIDTFSGSAPPSPRCERVGTPCPCALEINGFVCRRSRYSAPLAASRALAVLRGRSYVHRLRAGGGFSFDEIAGDSSGWGDISLPEVKRQRMKRSSGRHRIRSPQTLYGAAEFDPDPSDQNTCRSRVSAERINFNRAKVAILRRAPKTKVNCNPTSRLWFDVRHGKVPRPLDAGRTGSSSPRGRRRIEQAGQSILFAKGRPPSAARPPRSG